MVLPLMTWECPYHSHAQFGQLNESLGYDSLEDDLQSLWQKPLTELPLPPSNSNLERKLRKSTQACQEKT